MRARCRNGSSNGRRGTGAHGQKLQHGMLATMLNERALERIGCDCSGCGTATCVRAQRCLLFCCWLSVHSRRVRCVVLSRYNRSPCHHSSCAAFRRASVWFQVRECVWSDVWVQARSRGARARACGCGLALAGQGGQESTLCKLQYMETAECRNRTGHSHRS